MIKGLLIRAALWLEGLFDSRRARRTAKYVDAYIGYSTPQEIILRGRVLARGTSAEVREGQSLWANVRQMLGLFLTAEVEGVPVCVGETEARSDAEGYFRIVLPRGNRAAGWHEIEAVFAGQSVLLPVQVTGATAAFGVISDIDDTMMRTGAWSLRRNLWNSLTGNAASREVFEDAVRLMDMLSEDGRNPVFYVSSSPWNFHGFLADVFRRNRLRRGPMFLRDYGIGEDQLITGTHGDHKGQAIDVLIEANPNLPFVLIGDTGQHDPQVYVAAAERHSGRVKRVILRVPPNGLDAEAEAAIAGLRAQGVAVFVGPDYTEALAALGGQG